MNSLSFSIFLIADSVNKVALPGTVPGANRFAVNSSTLIMSVPGILFAAFNKSQSEETTISNPFFFLSIIIIAFFTRQLKKFC